MSLDGYLSIDFFYDASAAHEFESYGAALAPRSAIEVPSSIIEASATDARIDLQPKRRRRYAVTTDSNHDGLIFPDRGRGLVVEGPNQLWVADFTYIAITTGFVYLAAILDT